MSVRLSLALEAGAFDAAHLSRVALFGAPGDLDVDVFGGSNLTVVQPMMPDAARWQARGAEVLAAPEEGRFDLSLVTLPRAKADAQARIAAAMAQTDGPVLIDGQKTDGVESLLKSMRKVVPVLGAVSKAHGKLFWVQGGDAFSDWAAKPGLIDGRWHVEPGVFSADGVDPGSKLLAEHLPEKLGGHVADLGAGWGYLSACALAQCSGVKSLHLVEAHAGALNCARQNMSDARAEFHWADATTWSPPQKCDAVIMNPPFHSGRAAEPDLGRAFIAAAKRCLRPGGVLVMVANRHLPYERTLSDLFTGCSEIGGNTRFKILQARSGR
jgi:16S rRNA (guanine1207-N2)-methyltransferase